MAGVVGSAIAGEAVRKLSSLLTGEEGRDRETTEVKVDRVEMAVLKLETVVAMSEDWQITHAPLLRWKAKLKRVFKEGRAIVRSHRRRNATTELRMRRSNSLPRRMARVAKRFMLFGGHGTDDLSNSAVRRFERIADGADDFFEFVRCGGSRPNMFVPSFARPLPPGKTTELSLRMDDGTVVMLLQPWWLKIRGGGGGALPSAFLFLSMSYEHDLVRERNFKVLASFRTSDAVDVMTVGPNYTVLLPPEFGAFGTAAMKKLVAGMASDGRNSHAASAMYMSFVRAIQDFVTSHTTPE
uniref:Uncharacterized protein n=1 Tax=Avena sativa TaxID=4498 RepID=A0ACD5TH62_AVESA